MMKCVQLSEQDRARLQRSHDARASRAEVILAEHGECGEFTALAALARWSLLAPVAVVDLREAMQPFGGFEAPVEVRTIPAMDYFTSNARAIHALFDRPMTNLLIWTGTGWLHQLVTKMTPVGQVITSMLVDNGCAYMTTKSLTGEPTTIKSSTIDLVEGTILSMSQDENLEDAARYIRVYIAAANWLRRMCVELTEAEGASVH